MPAQTLGSSLGSAKNCQKNDLFCSLKPKHTKLVWRIYFCIFVKYLGMKTGFLALSVSTNASPVVLPTLMSGRFCVTTTISICPQPQKSSKSIGYVKCTLKYKIMGVGGGWGVAKIHSMGNLNFVLPMKLWGWFETCLLYVYNSHTLWKCGTVTFYLE